MNGETIDRIVDLRRQVEAIVKERIDIAVKEAQRKSNEALEEIVGAAQWGGWNGVENSKHLATFIKDLAEERDSLRKRLEDLECLDGWVSLKDRQPSEKDGTTFGESKGKLLFLGPYGPLVAKWNDQVSKDANRVTHWMRIQHPPRDISSIKEDIKEEVQLPREEVQWDNNSVMDFAAKKSPAGLWFWDIEYIRWDGLDMKKKGVITHEGIAAPDIEAVWEYTRSYGDLNIEVVRIDRGLPLLRVLPGKEGAS